MKLNLQDVRKLAIDLGPWTEIHEDFSLVFRDGTLTICARGDFGFIDADDLSKDYREASTADDVLACIGDKIN